MRLKKSTRCIPLPAILFILVMSLSACTGDSSDALVHAETAGDSAASARPPVAEDTTGTQAAAPVHAQNLSSKSLILTVNDAPVYWPEFHFWMNYIGKYYKAALGVEKITNWDADQNGMRLRDFFLTTAVGYAAKDRAIEAKAQALGIGLTEGDLAEIEEKRISNIKIYGSTSEYRRIVSSMYMSEDVFNYLTKIDYLGNYLFKHFYGANGEKFSDTDVSAYIREGGFMCATYIFLSNQDADGNSLDAEKRSENEALLKDLIGRLDASDTAPTLFAKLTTEYGQDRTLAQYPHGRLIVSGGKGEPFETACLKLKENEYSGIVTSDDGLYIILRMPIYPAMTADSAGNTLRYRAAYETFKKRVEAWSAEMKIGYQAAYYDIDVEGIL